MTLDLVRRRADRARRAARADRPRRERPQRRRGRARKIADARERRSPAMNRVRWSCGCRWRCSRRSSRCSRCSCTQPKDEFVASAMIGKPMPRVRPARRASPTGPGLSSADLADGKPRLLNVFASWCVPCRAEAPQLAALERSGARRSSASRSATGRRTSRAFLARYGNPFSRIGADDVSAGAARDRLVGRARDLRDRWQGRDPLPAHRRHPRRARAAAAREAARGRGDEAR